MGRRETSDVVRVLGLGTAARYVLPLSRNLEGRNSNICFDRLLGNIYSTLSVIDFLEQHPTKLIYYQLITEWRYAHLHFTQCSDCLSLTLLKGWNIGHCFIVPVSTCSSTVLSCIPEILDCLHVSCPRPRPHLSAPLLIFNADPWVSRMCCCVVASHLIGFVCVQLRFPRLANAACRTL